MTVSLTMTLNDILLAILLIGAIILVIYLIILIAKILPSIHYLEDALQDMAHITEKARNGVDEAETAIKDVHKKCQKVKRSLAVLKPSGLLSLLKALFSKE